MLEGFGSREAFSPVLEAVGQLSRGPDGARVVETLATQAPTWLVQFPALLKREHRETLYQEMLGATRDRMLREICEALESIPLGNTLLLVFEDLHCADYSTIDFISALARRRSPANVMLVATYRPLPTAVTAFPDEIYTAPRSWTERAYPNLIHYNKAEKGGHFAAWEQPQIFTEEVRASFRPLRKQLAGR